MKVKGEMKAQKKSTRPEAPSPRRARSGLRVQSGLRAGLWQVSTRFIWRGGW